MASAGAAGSRGSDDAAAAPQPQHQQRTSNHRPQHRQHEAPCTPSPPGDDVVVQLPPAAGQQHAAGWLPLKHGAAGVVHAVPCSPIASSSSVVASRSGGWSSVTPAVWLVAFVSVSFGYLQAVALQLSNNSKHSPHFMNTFFPPPQAAPRGVHAAFTHGGPTGSSQWCAAKQPSRGFSWVLAGQVAGSTLGHLIAAWLSAAHGRRASVWVGACICLAGIVLQGLAFSLAQLAAGYVCVGAGIGIMYQAVLLEDAEIAPALWRGMFVSLWQLGDKTGHLVAEGVYLYAPLIIEIPVGWRLAFTVAAWPAAVTVFTLPWLPETPNSLILRGKLADGQAALRRIRGAFVGSDALAAEALCIWKAAGCPAENASQVARVAWLARQLRQLFTRQHLPPLALISVLSVLAWLQDTASIIIIKGLMREEQTAMMHAVATLAALAANAAALLVVDRAGRRPLLVSAAAAGLATSAAMAALAKLRPRSSSVPLVLLYVGARAALGWGWPAWAALTTEHFALPVRSAGVAIVASLGSSAQTVALALQVDAACRLQWATILVMTGCSTAILGLAWLLPEAAQIPLEQVHEAWQQHWLWRGWYADAASSRPQQALCADRSELEEASLRQVP